MKQNQQSQQDEQSAHDGATWTEVSPLSDILPDTGIGALVGGVPIAVFRVGHGEEIYALDGFDPFSSAYVLARGIVGDKDGAPKVASPMYKHSFDLRTGRCLDDEAIRIATYPVRCRDGRVEVFAARRAESSADTRRR